MGMRPIVWLFHKFYTVYRSDDGLDVSRNWKPRRIVDCVVHDCIINTYMY